MCEFFSFVTDEKGNKYYFNDGQRNTICKDQKYDPDSHTSITDYYGFIGKKEDLLNKYEYDVIEQILKKDTIIFDEDQDKLLEWCKSLDFNFIDLKSYTLLNIFKLHKGKKFKVKSSCERPKYGWGDITHNSIGTVVKSFTDGFTFNFPEQNDWFGVIEEMEEIIN